MVARGCKSRLLPLALVLLLPLGARAQPVNFPDPNLEQVIRENLGIPAPLPITQPDMLNLTELEILQRGVSDLGGLQYAQNLTFLHLWRNQVADISPLSGLGSIRDLIITKEPVTDFAPLSTLGNLERLSVQDKPGMDLWSLTGALSGLVNLQVLGVHDCPGLDLSALTLTPQIKSLGLWGDRISDITPLSALKELTGLSLSWNRISDLSPLSGLTNLRQLWLNSNYLSDLSPLAGLDLFRLDAGSNWITSLSGLRGMTNLEQLYLSNNEITEISEFPTSDRLLLVNLLNNNICDISPLADVRIRYWLDLQQNPLNSEGYSTYIPMILSNNPGIVLNYDRIPEPNLLWLLTLRSVFLRRRRR